ncbi:MAG: hypothetical protein QOI64_1686 [Solirubrobacteraceae bacterium]|nr:hypothetical protein [Solirubrobacteraceae bacterium]
MDRMMQTRRGDAGTLVRALLHELLVDLMIEAYVDWREACGLVGDAHRAWASATPAGARVAFDLYLAALDQEERAAALYCGLVRRVEDVAR